MTERPNVLLFISDQLAAHVLGCYGGPVPTPNIDRLAREGVLFRDAVCPTPFCAPTRASIMTGVYPHSHGIVHGMMDSYQASPPPKLTEEGLTEEDVTTEKILNAAGYQTHQYGKWHLGANPLSYFTDMFNEFDHYYPPLADVFADVRQRPRDTWMDFYGWALPMEVSPQLRKIADALRIRFNGYRFSDNASCMGRLDLPLEQVFDVQVADRTVHRLRNLTAAPFMITCSLNYPHPPNAIPSPYYESFDPQNIILPANYGSRDPYFDFETSRQIVAAFGEVLVREFMRVYYASVVLLDDLVGRVLDELDATGRAEDTIVVFTADHGDFVGGHGQIWKQSSAFYDELVRVPLIIRYPAGFKRLDTSIPASSTDIMPTLLDVAGQPVPDDVQGRSLAPFLLGTRPLDQGSEYAFSERVMPHPEERRIVPPGAPANFMVRGKGWKYCRHNDGMEFLYDLVRDSGETRNLAFDQDSQARKLELAQELESWLEDTNYPV